MSTKPTQPSPDNGSPGDVLIDESRGISIIWLVPLLAALLGAWLAYQYYSEQGPLITITFETASGLAAGKTKIKYKEVDIGLVEKVELDQTLDKVVVSAKLVKSADAYLNENTRFWVVKPRIGAGGVSGLSTLLSGAYIQVDVGSGGREVLHFEGREEPPLTPDDAPGLRLVIQAEKAGSVNIGSPVYFKQLEVGQVESRRFADDYESILYAVFIHAPHHQLINSRTLFWNASGIDVSVGANGVNIHTESIEALISGGIAFYTPQDDEAGEPVENGTIFQLHPDFASTKKVGFTKKLIYILHFDGSVRGLKIGAPVEFRGVQVGSVIDLKLIYDTASNEIKIPILVELEPQRVIGHAETDPVQFIEAFVERGLRAQLQTGSLLTGQLVIALEIYPNAPPAQVKKDNIHPEIPTIPSDLSLLTQQAKDIIQKINNLPIEGLLGSATKTLDSVTTLVSGSQTQAIPKTLNKTLKGVNTTLSEYIKLAKQTNIQLAKLGSEINATLAASQTTLQGVSADSPLYYDLTKTLRELTAAARAIKILAGSLDDKPESLLFGKEPNER